MARIATIANIAALLLVCSLAVFPTGATSVWRGYVLLAVPAADGATAAARLATSGLPALSPVNAPVRYNDFSDFATVPLESLSGHLDPLDPRYDPYMKALPGYFTSDGESLVYARQGLSAPLTYLRIARAFRGLHWRALGFDLAEHVEAMGVVLLITIALTFRRARHGLASAAGGAACSATAFWGGFPAAIASAVVLLAWFYLRETWQIALPSYTGYRSVDRRRARATMVVCGGACLSVSCIAASLPGLGFAMLICVVALILLSVAAAARFVARDGPRAHTIFVGVEINQRIVRMKAFGERAREIGVIVVIVMLPLAGTVIRTANIEIPAPVMYAGPSRITMQSLDGLWKSHLRERLPDLSDYIAHTAYQAGLPYGRAYGYPERNETVALSTFDRSGMRIEEKREVVLRFDRVWLRTELRHAGGIARLLIRQGEPVSVVRRPIALAVRGRNAAAAAWLAAILGICPLLIALIRTQPSLETADRNETGRRSRSHAGGASAPLRAGELSGEGRVVATLANPLGAPAADPGR